MRHSLRIELTAQCRRFEEAPGDVVQPGLESQPLAEPHPFPVDPLAHGLQLLRAALDAYAAQSTTDGIQVIDATGKEADGRAGLHDPLRFPGYLLRRAPHQHFDRIEVADFGLSEFQTSGLSILTLQVTQEVGIKLIALYPWQICPEPPAWTSGWR